MLHVMLAKTRLSAGVVCDNTSLENSAYALNICWIDPYWVVNVICGDYAFNHPSFRNYVLSIGATFERIPPRSHQKRA